MLFPKFFSKLRMGIVLSISGIFFLVSNSYAGDSTITPPVVSNVPDTFILEQKTLVTPAASEGKDLVLGTSKSICPNNTSGVLTSSALNTTSSGSSGGDYIEHIGYNIWLVAAGDHYEIHGGGTTQLPSGHPDVGVTVQYTITCFSN